VGTDLIAGFPGETSRDLDDYFNFVDGLPLAYFHVFPYSIRAGTTAAKMRSQVEPVEIKRRAALLRELGEGKRAAFARRFGRSRLQVLLEEVLDDGSLRGYSRNYLRVLTQGDPAMNNHEVEVEVTRSFAARGELVGEIVGMAATAPSASRDPKSV
jgi:threonylcarbamoyladenosine tRNA methylthiotransferase MtaB